MKNKTNLLMIIAVSAMVIYYNIAYDLALIALLYLASYSIGSMVKLRGRIPLIDKIYIHTALGFGLVGVSLWLTTFYNLHYKSLYLILSSGLLVCRFKQITTAATFFRKSIAIVSEKNRLLIFLLFSFAIFYLIAASYPIGRSDVSVKHLAISIGILNKTNWDYNIIEGAYFAETALLSHMFSLYLLALEGTKALQLFVVSISFLTLFAILRISSKIDRSPVLANGITVVYLTTPAVFMFTSSMMCDIYPIYFAAVLLLLIYRFEINIVTKNCNVIALLMGIALFSKQSAMFFVLPIMTLLVCWASYHLSTKRISPFTLDIISRVIVSALLFLLAFLPPILLVWYKTSNPLFPFANGFFKSIYFAITNSIDGRWDVNPIKFDVSSFLSMILHTSRHWEWPDGGLGYIVIIFLFSPLLFYKRNKAYILLTVLTVLSFWFSTHGGSNARYKMGMIIFSIPVCVYLIRSCSGWIRHEVTGNLACYSLVMLFAVPNVHYILTPGWLKFSTRMLIPSKELTLVENEAILSPINRKGIRVLSNNDPARGAFRGEFYTLTWYNTFLVDKVLTKKIKPVEFMKAYDYYLVRKDQPLMYPELFSSENKELSQALQQVDADEKYVLYKINRQSPVISTVFDIPISVTMDNPVPMQFANNYSRYRMEIEAEKLNGTKAVGRFQLNWSDNSKMQPCSIKLFELRNGRYSYSSEIIEDVPQDATSGVMYLTSHDSSPILIHSCKLIGIDEKTDYLSKELQAYSKKWPHLSK